MATWWVGAKQTWACKLVISCPASPKNALEKSSTLNKSSTIGRMGACTSAYEITFLESSSLSQTYLYAPPVRLQAQFSGQSMEVITKDTDRDFFMSPQESIEYGLIDAIIAKPQLIQSRDVSAIASDVQGLLAVTSHALLCLCVVLCQASAASTQVNGFAGQQDVINVSTFLVSSQFDGCSLVHENISHNAAKAVSGQKAALEFTYPEVTGYRKKKTSSQNGWLLFCS
eukprot:1157991-Pelagomonas_calceolata.AAC.1